MGRCIVLLAICFLATELVSAAGAPSPLTRLLEGASTIKLATLVLAYQMADANTLKLDERVEITPAALRGGSGIYRFKDVGLRPTLRDILTEMVITSVSLPSLCPFLP